MTVSISVGGTSYEVPSSGTDTNWAALQLAWEQAVSAGLSAPTWVSATLVNSWVTFNVADQVASYWKDANGTVHVRGRIRSGTSATVCFTLPSGYRPLKREQFVIAAQDGTAEALIAADGTVTLTDVGTGDVNASASLAGINFSTV